MSETNVITKSKKFHHLNKFQRGQIEALLKLNLPKTQIEVGISRSTLYEELKRGTVTQMNSDLSAKNILLIQDKLFIKIVAKILASLSKFHRSKFF